MASASRVEFHQPGSAAYDLTNLIDWPGTKTSRWIATGALVFVSVPSALFLSVYLSRVTGPLAFDGKLVPGFGWATLVAGVDVFVLLLLSAYVIQSRSEPPISLTVDEHALVFWYRNGRDWSIPWDGPRFSLKAIAVPTPHSGPPYAQVRSWVRPQSRIPLESVERIIETATLHGLLVSERGRVDLPKDWRVIVIRRRS